MSATPTPGATSHQKKRRGPRPRPVPQRTCIACRTTAPKRAFVRVVRTPTGEVMIDPTGKKSGRGASVCGTRACWEKVMAGTLLDRALKVEVREEDRAALRAFVATLPPEAGAQTDTDMGAGAPGPP